MTTKTVKFIEVKNPPRPKYVPAKTPQVASVPPRSALKEKPRDPVPKTYLYAAAQKLTIPITASDLADACNSIDPASGMTQQMFSSLKLGILTNRMSVDPGFGIFKLGEGANLGFAVVVPPDSSVKDGSREALVMALRIIGKSRIGLRGEINKAVVLALSESRDLTGVLKIAENNVKTFSTRSTIIASRDGAIEAEIRVLVGPADADVERIMISATEALIDALNIEEPGRSMKDLLFSVIASNLSTRRPDAMRLIRARDLDAVDVKIATLGPARPARILVSDEPAKFYTGSKSSYFETPSGCDIRIVVDVVAAAAELTRSPAPSIDSTLVAIADALDRRDAVTNLARPYIRRWNTWRSARASALGTWTTSRRCETRSSIPCPERRSCCSHRGTRRTPCLRWSGASASTGCRASNSRRCPEWIPCILTSTIAGQRRTSATSRG
jgi:hypothetical protein